MRRSRRPSAAKPFKLRLFYPDGKRRPARSYERAENAHEMATRWLHELKDGRRGYPQPVATITGPGVRKRYTVAAGEMGIFETRR